MTGTWYSWEELMSYRCEVCDNAVPPGTPCVRHVVYRKNGQIERELKVCGGCKRGLEKGANLDAAARSGGAVRLYKPTALRTKGVRMPGSGDTTEQGHK